MAYDTVEMFVYTGVGEGAVAPKGIVRVRVDPSVLAIPHEAFYHRRQLQEVSFITVYVKLVVMHSTGAQP
jgi:hypothetical protein